MIFCALTISLVAQNGYDNISRSTYSIVKPSNDIKSGIQKKASLLKTTQDVKDHFGKNYKSRREYLESVGGYYTQFEYSDGFTLQLPEDENGDIWFDVNSEQYTLALDDGTEIRVGMKADELQKIFPQSFLKRKTIKDIKGKEGDISFIVFLSNKTNNRTIIEDEWVTFILDKDTGLLKEFYLYKPL